MKIIYAKFNRERLPYFQTLTKIVEYDNGSRAVIKEPLTESAVTHIKTIYDNYSTMTADNNIKLCKSRLENNTIIFDMASGESFEKKLLANLYSGDISAFYKLMDSFNDYLDSMVTIKKIKFTPCAQFSEIFGEFQSDELCDILNIANIDLIFGNIFIDDESITQIDYEWVFSFPILKEFILWRAIHAFYFFHGSDCIMPDENTVLEKFGLNGFVPSFKKMELNFQIYVYGEDYVKADIDFKTAACKTIEKKLADKNWVIAERDKQINQLNDIIFSLKNSFSWKLTKPVRYIGTLLKLK